ncbi:DUF4368 domain-containing protein [Pseudoramibacter alactolyticus]|uniref:DUF4368 domain-containing protein n=1 Tax=Pseudoramibacter alactolyticus TaxID=113287 RepID=UPI0028EC8333|nr:DUF4368 domain-containing protein [Pseudoramibacter alactolyticus]
MQEFVEKIYIYKAEKSPAGRRTQRIKIIRNCTKEFKPPKRRSTEESYEIPIKPHF